ncbi:hypothetical protein EYR38_005126 [Pleurotus pulmonarius]|nr:hypothetical protein EYR38_005126 [Pleurotus pulmonarius]
MATAEDRRKSKVFTHDFGILPIPKHLRYDPDKPFHFGVALNLAFGFASTFTVANLYYCQPLLIELAKAFNVSYSEASNIPTLVQAGYACGIVFISPLGDLVRRRQLIIILVLISASLSIGLAVTSNLAVFEALCFLIGVVTVTPQVLLPLAADLAPPNRRAAAISMVLSGLLFGVLIARVLAGVIGQFTTYRVVYYMAIGVQYFVMVGCYFFLPDYPAKNDHLTYWDILWTMGKFACTEPLLIQACMINIAGSACFSSYWVTLTFLLGGPPYNYSTLVIGLFGLIGMWGVAMGPLVGRLIDRLVPWYATLAALLALICVQSIQVGAGGIHVAAVIVTCLGLDLFRQMQQVSLSTAIFGILPEARARLNAVFILSLFIGQVMGTAVGTKVFIEHGWRPAAALNLAWYGWQLFVLLLRGPHCLRHTWFGYEGGLESRKSVVEARSRKDEEAVSTIVGNGEEKRASGDMEKNSVERRDVKEDGAPNDTTKDPADKTLGDTGKE